MDTSTEVAVLLNPLNTISLAIYTPQDAIILGGVTPQDNYLIVTPWDTISVPPHTLQLFRVYSRYIRHGVFISLWEFIWGLIHTLVQGFCLFLQFFMGPKELME